MCQPAVGMELIFLVAHRIWTTFREQANENYMAVGSEYCSYWPRETKMGKKGRSNCFIALRRIRIVWWSWFRNRLHMLQQERKILFPLLMMWVKRYRLRNLCPPYQSTFCTPKLTKLLTIVYLKLIMSLDLIRSLARDGEVFTIDEAVAKTSIKKEVLRVLLSRLETRGLIERIEKGKYLIFPLDSSHGGYSLHEFVGGSLLVHPCAIS